MKKIDNTALLFDLTVFSSRRGQLLSICENWLKEPLRLHVIYTPNPEQVIQSRGDDEFKQTLQQADLLLPDGVGLVLAAKFLALLGRSKPLAERIAGVDVVDDLLKLARQQNLRVLVVGGRDYSSLDYFTYQRKMISWTLGYEDATQPTAAEEQQLSLKIEEIRPAIVFVSFGAPTQELWIEQHRALLAKNGVVIAMAVGGSFDYLLGKVKRAPSWVRQLGLEWLFRLIMEPWRIGRQLRIVNFLGLTIKKAIEK